MSPRREGRGWAATSLGLTVMLVLAGCGGSEECSSPDSAQLAVGESTPVELQVSDGSWGTVDVGGRFWIPGDPVPPGIEEDGEVAGTATQVSEDVIEIDLGGHGVIHLRSADLLGCE